MDRQPPKKVNIIKIPRVTPRRNRQSLMDAASLLVSLATILTLLVTFSPC